MYRLEFKISIYLMLMTFFCSSLMAESGFYPKASSAVPQAVQGRRQSIFRLDIPAFLTMPTKEAKSFLTAKLIKEEGIKVIHKCLKRNEVNCTFPITHLQGTSFLNPEGTGIWTNCHLIDGWVQFKKQEALWQDI
jgi:hypothetical protein